MSDETKAPEITRADMAMIADKAIEQAREQLEMGEGVSVWVGNTTTLARLANARECIERAEELVRFLDATAEPA